MGALMTIVGPLVIILNACIEYLSDQPISKLKSARFSLIVISAAFTAFWSLNWPGTSILEIATLLALCVFYSTGGMGLIEAHRQMELARTNRWSRLFFWTVIGLFIMHVIFGIMHWPFASVVYILIIFGVLLLIWSTVLLVKGSKNALGSHVLDSVEDLESHSSDEF